MQRSQLSGFLQGEGNVVCRLQYQWDLLDQNGISRAVSLGKVLVALGNVYLNQRNLNFRIFQDQSRRIRIALIPDLFLFLQICFKLKSLRTQIVRSLFFLFPPFPHPDQVTTIEIHYLLGSEY